MFLKTFKPSVNKIIKDEKGSYCCSRCHNKVYFNKLFNSSRSTSRVSHKILSQAATVVNVKQEERIAKRKFNIH